ncbi:type 1 glutamine amidotransferase domain-containing protein [soil metagenome]
MPRALFLVGDRFEDLSLFLPWYRLREEGVEVTLASSLLHGLTGIHGYCVEPDCRINDVTPTDFDLLVIPDGSSMTESLRMREEALDVTRTLAQEGRVAAIGHGAQVLQSAGALDGRTVTASPGIRDDIRAAGALYKDEAVVLDGNMLTGRSVDDLPEFNRALVRFLRQIVKV